MRRWAFRTAVVAVAVAATASCSSDGADRSRAATTMHGFDKMLGEFHDASAQLELPPGASYTDPKEPKPDTLPDGTVAAPSYEEGFGDTLATTQWFCAWESAWLGRRESDPAGADAALDTLKTIYDSQVYEKYWDASTQGFTQESLQKADLGDPSLVAADVDANCS